MHYVVVIPGIEGSVLKTPAGETVWPPTVIEAVTGYRRVGKLKQPDLAATGIIRSVCIDVYGSLLDALDQAGFTLDGAKQRRIEFAYDWRRDLLAAAKDLEQMLASLAQEAGAGVKISLVCHSMGGLLARACLEAQRAAAPGWLKAVDLCVFLATPHEGAPLALSRAAGLGGASEGVSAADFRSLANTPGFPAAFELFPAQDLSPIWDLADAHVPFAGVGVFDPKIVGGFGLNAQLVAAAKAFQAALDERRRPSGCRYFSIVSAFHDTVTRFDYRNGALTQTSVGSSGDGTVPIRSAAALRVQTAFVSANHMGVAQSPTAHQLLGMLLGVAPPDVVAAAVQARATETKVSVSQRIVARGQPFEVVVAFAVAGEQEGQVVFSRQLAEGEQAEGAGVDGFVTERAWSLTITGAPAQRVVLEGPTDLKPGRYRVTFQSAAGTYATDLVVTVDR